MWFLFLFFYNVVCVPLMYVVFVVGAFFNNKIKQGLTARIYYFKKVKTIVSNIPANSKVILFHSSSVGEWEQAVPIINELKSRDSSIYVVVTFFSPSGFNIVKNPIIDAKLYMPFDSWLGTRRFFALIKPKIWIICKYDVWPNMLASAKHFNVPVILTSAELAEDSTRYTFPMKYVNRVFYKKIDRILTISQDTRDRFLNIFPYDDRLTVSGDSRYDQIYQKAQKILEDVPLEIFKSSSKFKFIVGSSWPADEKHILPALIRLCEKYPHIQILVVPHEINEKHIQDIELDFYSKYIKTERDTDFLAQGGTDCRVAIINTIGLLAKLYRTTQLAYVGGAFSTGVHNVLEPAVFGQPVIFGPRYKNSYEACKLVDNLAAHSIHNENEFEVIVDYLIQKETLRIDKGNDAKRFLVDNLGGTKKTIKEIEALGII